MSSPTELYLPPSFPYPVKIVSLDVNPPTDVERGTRLLSYSFVHLPPTPGAQPETRFGTWDCAVEGTVESWKIRKGDIISERRAKEKPVILVTEPCKHGVQIGGLCGLCGKDMTGYDYTGFSDASRASIQMTHSAFGPTVSFEEAQRIERETAEHLLKSRKLSLIVDLDQTIVHATVDPTVGEWISEGESWEARQAQKASTSKDVSKGNSDDSDDTVSESDDECNPNWEALKDVKKFRLGPESFGAPSPQSQMGKGKHKLIENEGCMYYIKPRPGWSEFLQNTASKYEMHVYTMGTRAYAEEVCAAIDPHGKLFGGRLLSRDESGSLTQKSLQRLFPCDTSMVVIIDDRADVWEWSPNLIKVIPYDFFIGIGDINSTFLPKVEPLTAVVPPRPPSAGDSPGSDADNAHTTDDSSIGPPSSSSPASSSPESESTVPSSPAPATPEERERAEMTTKAMLTQNSLALEAQLEERPLAKKQEELQHPHDASSNAKANEGNERPASENPSEKNHRQEAEPKPEKFTRKALLKNDDVELDRVSRLLEEVHSRFFSAYDRRSPHARGKKRRSSKSQGSLTVPYDVTNIIPSMRSETLAGVHILFSSVIPLDTRPESTEIWRMANVFGATCYTELSSRITHVVAAKRGTVKVDAARKRGGIHVVWLSWFTDSIALWRRQDETPYLLDDAPSAGPSSSPILDPNQISSDPEPDTDDWDEGDGGPPQSFELNEIDWNDINDEVDAAMNESDDDDDARSDRSGMRSGNVSDDESSISEGTNSANSAQSTPRLKRKRLRSLTPSEVGINGNGDSGGNDTLRSPLAKRKKIAAGRSGYSKLKEAISADDIVDNAPPGETVSGNGTSTSPVDGVDEVDEDVDEGEGDDEEEDEEDFLARELEEEWG